MAPSYWAPHRSFSMNESISHIECLLPMKSGAAHLIGSSFNGSILTLSLSHNWVCTQAELSKRSPKLGLTHHLLKTRIPLDRKLSKASNPRKRHILFWETDPQMWPALLVGILKAGRCGQTSKQTNVYFWGKNDRVWLFKKTCLFLNAKSEAQPGL